MWAGFCPFTEFERTKHDFGACQNLHDDNCKADWEKLDDKEKERLGYERELKRWIDKLMGDLRAKIARNEERLSQQEQVVFLPDDQVNNVARLSSAKAQPVWLHVCSVIRQAKPDGCNDVQRSMAAFAW